jgi:predicted O-linked N-acetylglucosamine transferase (SPINDLY family)
MPESPASIARDAAAMLADGRIGQALALLDPARVRHPQSAAIAMRFADALHAARRLSEAVVAYAAALRLDDRSADGWFGAGCAHLALNSYGAAAAAFARAASLAPGSGAVQYNFAKSLFELGQVDAALWRFERAANLDADLAAMAAASVACIVPGAAKADGATVLRARRHWAAIEARALPTEPSQARAHFSPARKLRIGYMSAFFGARNWMKPVFGLINRHDRDRFEIHMFCDGAPPSPASGYRDRDDDVIYEIRGVANDRAAAIIAEAGIDVLVDLNGYSFQSRLPMLMRRPAPRIVGWFNMFATTGIGAFDWLVGDATVIRPDEESAYCERIHRVPGSYLAFETLYPTPEVVPPPCATPGAGIVFGCLGSQYKLTDGVLAAWAEILGAAPTASLFIRNGSLDHESTRDDLLGRLRALGVDPARVTLEGRGEHFDFLDSYRHIDIALDTFPYNGGTTTMEALWQGVPVLAFDGDRWAARTSKSLLMAAGLHDWLMPDQPGYLARAVGLANDPETPAMLATLRTGLRARLRDSAACDTAGLCAAMEQFYTGICRVT